MYKRQGQRGGTGDGVERTTHDVGVGTERNGHGEHDEHAGGDGGVGEDVYKRQAMTCDSADRERVFEVVAKAIETYGSIDVIVNNGQAIVPSQPCLLYTSRCV